jgi:hypothetical protein
LTPHSLSSPIVSKIIFWWRQYIYRSSSVTVEEEDHEVRRKKKAVLTPWEQDYALSDVGRLSFMEEYLEMGN